jgi:hypothetical protein
MPHPRRLDPSKLSAIEAIVALALIFTGAAIVSLPVALLLTGLLIWQDATRGEQGAGSKEPGEKP